MNKIGNIEINNYIDDLIVIDVPNSKEFIKNINMMEMNSESPSIVINDKYFYLKDSYFFDTLTKMSDLYEFSVKNQLVKTLINDSNWNTNNILKIENLEFIKNSINGFVGDELLNINVDFSKIYKYIFTIDGNKFANKNKIINWLKNELNSTTKLVIIDNIPNISIRELYELTPKYKFIILTNNIFNHCEKFEDLELCGFLFKDEIKNITSNDIFVQWIKKLYPSLKEFNEQEIIKHFKNDIFSYFELKKHFFL
ncbi:hypothetical protein [Mycoplasma sp. Mirounga ES2805-ORL]|uniref:hypothetical protein n=1 Tax=Mycoplasma sp. Mirounga ES2805-ORL TaxID=754514 RepID=UPI00197B66ED|nr:hypothetical protein [Mycoplasma sp. Mirounga ES2805-ORL]QSF13701.1 hypothetical protein JXZ90_00135 [Mycoplasma sp. Mirounga ES2805-ORL]